MPLFLIFLTVPLIEIALFIEVGGFIGLWPTLGVVVLTAIAGSTLLRSQGSAAMAHIKSSFRNARDPSGPLAHGALILIGGVLLLTPGFFTDTMGLLLLVPQFRDFAIKRASRKVSAKIAQSRPQPRQNPDIIEGDFQNLDR